VDALEARRTVRVDADGAQTGVAGKVERTSRRLAFRRFPTWRRTGEEKRSARRSAVHAAKAQKNKPRCAQS